MTEKTIEDREDQLARIVMKRHLLEEKKRLQENLPENAMIISMKTEMPALMVEAMKDNYVRQVQDRKMAHKAKYAMMAGSGLTLAYTLLATKQNLFHTNTLDLVATGLTALSGAFSGWIGYNIGNILGRQLRHIDPVKTREKRIEYGITFGCMGAAALWLFQEKPLVNMISNHINESANHRSVTPPKKQSSTNTEHWDHAVARYHAAAPKPSFQ